MYHLCAHPLLNKVLKNTNTNQCLCQSSYPRQCLVVVSSSLVVSRRYAFLINRMLRRHLTLILENHKYDKFLIIIIILKKPHSPIQKNQCGWSVVGAEEDWGGGNDFDAFIQISFFPKKLPLNFELVQKRNKGITCSIYIPWCCCRGERHTINT